jgi:MtfA peptidase
MWFFTRRRRKKLKALPFPDIWRAILDRKVPYYRAMPEEDKAELHGHIQVFLHEKAFEGLQGVTIDDEIRLLIAAQACILLLHRDSDYYPDLRSILVYPRKYYAKINRRQPDGTVVEGYESRLGESWHRGELVLSWEDVQLDAADPDDGFNVVFHEFAHQLDSESGFFDGTPKLPRFTMYAEWGEIFSRDYLQHVEAVQHRRGTFLDPYGATNPAEFFAVSVEDFFEKPVALLDHHPELYMLLAEFFQQDPAERFRDAGRVYH